MRKPYEVFVEILPDGGEVSPDLLKTAQVVLRTKTQDGRSKTRSLDALATNVMDYQGQALQVRRKDIEELMIIVSVYSEPPPGATLIVRRLLDGRYELLYISHASAA